MLGVLAQERYPATDQCCNCSRHIDCSSTLSITQPQLATHLRATVPLRFLGFLREFLAAVVTVGRFLAGFLAARCLAAFCEASFLKGIDPPVLLRATCCRRRITAQGSGCLTLPRQLQQKQAAN